MIIQEIKLYDEPVPVLYTPPANLTLRKICTQEQVDKAVEDAAMAGIGIGFQFKYKHNKDILTVDAIETDCTKVRTSQGAPAIFKCSRMYANCTVQTGFTTSYTINEILSPSMEILL